MLDIPNKSSMWVFETAYPGIDLTLRDWEMANYFYRRGHKLIARWTIK